jgi:hypothetical protein
MIYQTVRTHICLDPFHAFNSFGFLGHAYYMLRLYREAGQTLRVYAANCRTAVHGDACVN